MNPLAGVLADRFGIRGHALASGPVDMLAVGSVLIVFIDGKRRSP